MVNQHYLCNVGQKLSEWGEGSLRLSPFAFQPDLHEKFLLDKHLSVQANIGDFHVYFIQFSQITAARSIQRIYYYHS